MARHIVSASAVCFVSAGEAPSESGSGCNLLYVSAKGKGYRLNQKTKSIVLIVLAVIGLFIAGIGLSKSAGSDPQSGGKVITWLGIGITFLASFLMIFSAKK
ncbi:MAG: hypothetical protein JNJ50_15415 [Acidobacteria bacterium]|nr:hypothetical protein [Acidobacteriota bacterium]